MTDALPDLDVLVVDDEPLARDTLTDLVRRAEGFRLAGTCADGDEALRTLRRIQPDILLLDIEMPVLRGIDLLACLPTDARPAVVLVTAYAEHAVRAFELGAVDYLLKPFADQRFFEVLARARQRVIEQRMARLAAALTPPTPAGAESSTPTAATVQRLAVTQGATRVLVPVDDVRWIESDDYCVRLHTKGGRHVLRASLATLERTLDPDRFLRVHRGAIVRADTVREIRRRGHGGRILVLDDGTEVAVSRSRVRAVEARFTSPG